jgi:ankyrin repeat protein
VKRIAIILSMLVLGSHLAQAIDKVGEIYDAIKNEDVEKVKINLAADTNAANSMLEKRFTLLHFAAEHRSSNGTEILKLLLDKGAKIEARNLIGQTPLFCAAAYDNPEGARILIAEGAKVNARQNDGRTPLHWAAVNGYCDVAKVLITNKANKKARDSNGNTPLDSALEGRSEAKGNPHLTRQYNDMIALLQEKTDPQ